MVISEIIRQRIMAEGAISFHDFMEMALYYPDLGYYTSPEDKIGKKGDFYTSSNLTPLFGAMIGRQMEEMWDLLGRNNFTIVEYGAGTGALCRDILAYLKNNPELYSNLNYCIIEKSPVMRAKEQSHLNEKVSWYDSIQDIPEITGCIISNELLDNLAVHQVVMEDELMEVFVDYKDGFVEVLKPAEKPLADYFAALNVHLPKGFRTEVNLEAAEWIKEIALALEKGYVLTIDYGYPSDELYRDYRRTGTLLCYNNHTINENPYVDVGEQDITTHVNFSALIHWGLEYGLEYCGFTDQGNFLLCLGFKEDLRKMILEPGPDYMNFKKELFLTRTLLLDMGRKFKVLMQGKNIPKQKLMGLKLA